MTQASNITTITGWRVIGKGKNRAIVFTLPVDKVFSVSAVLCCSMTQPFTLCQSDALLLSGGTAVCPVGKAATDMVDMLLLNASIALLACSKCYYGV